MIRQVEYFDQAGKENTERCLEIVEGLVNTYEDVVVASTSGETGLKFAERLGKKTNLGPLLFPLHFDYRTLIVTQSD